MRIPKTARFSIHFSLELNQKSIGNTDSQEISIFCMFLIRSQLQIKRNYGFLGISIFFLLKIGIKGKYGFLGHLDFYSFLIRVQSDIIRKYGFLGHLDFLFVSHQNSIRIQEEIRIPRTSRFSIRFSLNFNQKSIGNADS